MAFLKQDDTNLYVVLQDDGRGSIPFLQLSTAMSVSRMGATKPLYKSAGKSDKVAYIKKPFKIMDFCKNFIHHIFT